MGDIQAMSVKVKVEGMRDEREREMFSGEAY